MAAKVICVLHVEVAVFAGRAELATDVWLAETLPITLGEKQAGKLIPSSHIEAVSQLFGSSSETLEKHFEFHALHGFLRVGGHINYPTIQANKNPSILGQIQKYLGA